MGLGSQGRITVHKAAVYAQGDSLMHGRTKLEKKPSMSTTLLLRKYQACSNKDCSNKKRILWLWHRYTCSHARSGQIINILYLLGKRPRCFTCAPR